MEQTENCKANFCSLLTLLECVRLTFRGGNSENLSTSKIHDVLPAFCMHLGNKMNLPICQVSFPVIRLGILEFFQHHNIFQKLCLQLVVPTDTKVPNQNLPIKWPIK